MFINYGWTPELLRSSSNKAEDRHYELFFGIDCWGRGTYGGGQYNCHKALQALSELQVCALNPWQMLALILFN